MGQDAASKAAAVINTGRCAQFMGDEKQILRQRRRENLFELLGLLGDDRKQIEYGQSVGDKIAIDELQCMWFDDHYRADEPEFQTEYDKEELNALKKFNDFYESIPKTIFGDSLNQLTKEKEWIELTTLAKATLKQMKKP